MPIVPTIAQSLTDALAADVPAATVVPVHEIRHPNRPGERLRITDWFDDTLYLAAPANGLVIEHVTGTGTATITTTTIVSVGPATAHDLGAATIRDLVVTTARVWVRDGAFVAAGAAADVIEAARAGQ